MHFRSAGWTQAKSLVFRFICQLSAGIWISGFHKNTRNLYGILRSQSLIIIKNNNKYIDYFLWKLGSVFLISKQSIISISIPVNAAVIKAKSGHTKNDKYAIYMPVLMWDYINNVSHSKWKYIFRCTHCAVMLDWIQLTVTAQHDWTCRADLCFSAAQTCTL